MYKILAIFGEAGTGKDTLFQHTLNKLIEAHEIISCTTRPKREGEVEGINYYYMTPDQFGQKVLDGEMLEATYFNDWFYGTSYDSLRADKLNIGVFNPDGIRAIAQDPRVKFMGIKINCSKKTRLLRQLNREQNPDVDEIIRRYKADNNDFCDLEFPYVEVNNETYEDLESCVNTIIDVAQELMRPEDKKG